MEGYLKMKTKRKEFDHVNDDCFDFSLSSPARKIRRLDAEFLPTIEEEEQEIPHSFYEQSEKFETRPPIIEELPPEPVNDERAIVLFKPFNSPVTRSPSSFFVSSDSGIMSGFRNQILWSCQPELNSVNDDKAAGRNNGVSNACMAVVPWVPSQGPTTSSSMELSRPEDAELMETDEMGESTMEIEENTGSVQPKLESELSRMMGWQHCMTPQLPPQSPSTPIVWYR